ncbi:hypothetical protein CPB83DRAFT_844432 [Crepidotus variabilis]|uniref:Uncharacterized protein n=1 Tax=Crepidotus variabilis TaxID=179855 RepID=A0A9P6ER57_9AGAR|nr:hypothetical protein CPB83DRAFT_844432 [Crepidotus variabilis]
MATLDGLVAALELFDALPSLPNTKIVASYIVHFVGAPADSSRKPNWNDNIMMDDLGWESLPNELKKRNIRYNVLSLQPIQGRLSEFYSAMNGNGDPSTPWFEIRPQYSLYAASIVALEIKGQPGKRSSEQEITVDRTPDNKRPRLQGNADSPKPTPKNTVSQHSSQSSLSQPKIQPPSQSAPKPPIPAQAPAATHPQPPKLTPQLTPASAPVAQPPTSVQAPPLASRIPPNFSPADAYQRFGQVEASITALEAQLANARLTQQQDQIEHLGKELNNRKELHNKMKMAFDAHFKMIRSQPPAVPNVLQNQQPPPSNPLTSNIPTAQPPTATPPAPTTQDLMPTAHARSLSAASSIPSTTPTLTPAMPNITGNPQSISVQMQKMIEQNQRSQQTTPNLTMGGVPPHMQMPGGQVGMDPTFTGPSATPGTGNMPGTSRVPATTPQPEWNGALKWSGTAATGKKEMQCAVTVNSIMHPKKAYEDTWPPIMTLIPAPEQFPINDMHDFIKKHQPSVALFKPAINEADAQNYKSLMHLLITKKIYATSSWPNPSGMITRNIIFFPHTHHSILAGAVFPVTGLPPLPTLVNPSLPTSLPPNLPPALASLPLTTLQALQKMPPEQRQQVLARIMQQNMAQQQQAAAAAQLQNQNDGGLSAIPLQPQLPPGINNLTTALNIMGPTQGAPPVNHGGMPNNLQNRMPGNPGNVPGNFSYEMIQSFMQRSAGEGGPKS